MLYTIELHNALAPALTANDLLYVPVQDPPRIKRTRRYLFTYEGDPAALDRFARRVLVDEVSEDLHAGEAPLFGDAGAVLDMTLKPGLLDHEREAVLEYADHAAPDGVEVQDLRIHQRMYIFDTGGTFSPDRLVRDLVNPAIHQWTVTDPREAGPAPAEGGPRAAAAAAAKPPPQTHRDIALRDLDDNALGALSRDMKLSLSTEDMRVIRAAFAELGREPTDVELEVLAQTWSEHCKHRIFNAHITCREQDRETVVDGLFKTFIKDPTEAICRRKPGFVLSAFHDNAGFIKLNEDRALCYKVETHNHPSAIEPYAGANTGLGGVIRDILGAGKGARPIASLDVFCFGRPDTPPEAIRGRDVIHPIGILRGVVRGVRDYGNRMGIPTVTGSILFDDGYLYNPLVYCGTAGVIDIRDIEKKVEPGDHIVVLGGRTGRDGLHGATFSSASLGTDSHEEDQGAVQIGNPIEEKKVTDCVLQAREEGLIHFITDCGAGGLSSAAGEMVEDVGGEIHLDRVPLKEPGLASWEVFLSESQERMVLAVAPEDWARLHELAETFETEATIIGSADGSGRLKVFHHDTRVCDLDCRFLHEAPRKALTARIDPRPTPAAVSPSHDPGKDLLRMLASTDLCSREPVIREYDHEVQGNTVLKPLAGPGGDNPQDGSVIRLDECERLMALGVALLPFYHRDPERMARATVDEAIRQLVVTGADPDQIALLDNYCVGNPDDPAELGRLVACARGMAEAAEAYGAPFISGKDSFYNYFETEAGPESIPLSLLISSIGLLDRASDRTGASLTRADSILALAGRTEPELGGSAYARMLGEDGSAVPDLNPDEAMASYRTLHRLIQRGAVRAAHDLSEGGLAVALAEMGFSGTGGIEVDLEALPADPELDDTARLFSESTGRILLELDPEALAAVEEEFTGLPFAVLGASSAGHRDLVIRRGEAPLIRRSLEELKHAWKTGLTPYY